MRTPRHAKRFFTEVVEPYDGDECLLWPHANIKGYAVLNIGGKVAYVCRMLAGPKPEGCNIVAHSCGRGRDGCVTRRHLRWTNQKGNMADTLIHGTRNRGSRNGRSLLKEAEVLEIKSARGVTREALAARFNVSEGAIKSILSGDNWSWLTTEGESQ